jgi:hypothetical protein
VNNSRSPLFLGDGGGGGGLVWCSLRVSTAPTHNEHTMLARASVFNWCIELVATGLLPRCRYIPVGAALKTRCNKTHPSIFSAFAKMSVALLHAHAVK